MDEYVEVFTASDITFAYLMKAALENAGIPVQITNENLQGAYCLDGMTPRVLVPETFAEQARQIIKEIQQNSQKDLEDNQLEDIAGSNSKGKYGKNLELRDKFLLLWDKYFNNSELPIIFYYTNEPVGVDLIRHHPGHRCIIADLLKVRAGNSVCFDADSVACFGGRRYLGFSQEIRPDFDYFLSCGIPGKVEGERYRKTPELVKELMEKVPKFEAPAKYIVFKRWDMLEESDEPDVVIFFAYPDVLSGLFTLANFDADNPNGVICPFSAGCGSIVQYPYFEKDSDCPRAVLGMFDVSARPYVSENILSFSMPMKKFITMVNNMQESFLITKSWDKVNKRIK